jgi:hypothetical protein
VKATGTVVPCEAMLEPGSARSAKCGDGLSTQTGTSVVVPDSAIDKSGTAHLHAHSSAAAVVITEPPRDGGQRSPNRSPLGGLISLAVHATLLPLLVEVDGGSAEVATKLVSA